MGVPCSPVSTVEVAEGAGISVTLLAGVYTVSLDPAVSAQFDNYKIYATEAARDTDNPTPSSGDAAWITADDRLWVHDGTGWVVMAEPTQTYVPATTNLTVGAGTLTGFSHRSDGWCDFRAKFILGSGSAVGSLPTLGLPYACAGIEAGMLNVQLFDSTPNGFVPGFSNTVSGGGSAVELRWQNVAATMITISTIAAASPFTWAAPDYLALRGRYQMNTRYL